MSRHIIISRFGLMHMIATNLCEWLYVLVEETKHEIIHLGGTSKTHIRLRFFSFFYHIKFCCLHIRVSFHSRTPQRYEFVNKCQILSRG